MSISKGKISFSQVLTRVWSKTWPPLIVFLILFFLWEVCVRFFKVKPQILPAPSRIWETAIADYPALWKATYITIMEGLSGLILACVVGVILAAALYCSAALTRTLQPLLVISQTIPLIAIAPLLIIWLGFGPEAKILLVTIYGLFPITIATFLGLKDTPLELIEVAKTWQCSKLWILIHICWRHALPQFFSGFRIVATYTFATAAMAEFVGAENGLGIYILSAQSSFRADLVFVGAFTLAIATLVLFGIVVIAEKLCLAYRHSEVSTNERGF